MSRVSQLGALGAVIVAALACAARAEPRGTLEIAHGFRITPPAGWQERDRTRNSLELVKPGPSGAVLARTLVTTETRTSADDAVQRLGDIAAEQPQAPALTVIAGWPAIERKTTAALPRTGDDARTRAPAAPPETAVTATVAIAAGATIVRFETTLSPGADPRLLDEILARTRKLDLDVKGDARQAQRALDEVRRVMRKRLETAPPPLPLTTPR